MQLRRVPWLLLLAGGCGGAYATSEDQDAGVETPVEAGAFEAGVSIRNDGSVTTNDTGSTEDPVVEEPKDSSAPSTQDSGTDSAISDPDAGFPNWTKRTITIQNALGTCNGATYIRWNTKYQLFVGVRLCTAKRYKIYLSKTLDGTYYEIGDGSGGGEDHCELVVPTFTEANCPSCNEDYAGTGVTGGPNIGAFTRNKVGDTPGFHASWPGNAYTAHWYECNASIP